MCVFSMVHDHFEPKFPDVQPWVQPTPIQPFTPHKPEPQPIDWSKVFPNVAGQAALEKALAELRQLIADFREASAAAKKVDALTGQPDCVDPEKAKLEERVAALEKALAKRTRAKSRRGKR